MFVPALWEMGRKDWNLVPGSFNLYNKKWNSKENCRVKLKVERTVRLSCATVLEIFISHNVRLSCATVPEVFISHTVRSSCAAVPEIFISDTVSFSCATISEIFHSSHREIFMNTTGEVFMRRQQQLTPEYEMNAGNIFLNYPLRSQFQIYIFMIFFFFFFKFRIHCKEYMSPTQINPMTVRYFKVQ